MEKIMYYLREMAKNSTKSGFDIVGEFSTLYAMLHSYMASNSKSKDIDAVFEAARFFSAVTDTLEMIKISRDLFELSRPGTRDVSYIFEISYICFLTEKNPALRTELSETLLNLCIERFGLEYTIKLDDSLRNRNINFRYEF